VYLPVAADENASFRAIRRFLIMAQTRLDGTLLVNSPE
jgi:hypothetical protein